MTLDEILKNPELFAEVKKQLYAEFRTEGESLEEENRKLKAEREELTRQLDEHKTWQALREKRKQVTKLVQSYHMPSEAFTESFLELLEAQGNENDMRCLINERLGLIARLEGSKTHGNGHIINPESLIRFSKYGFG